MNSAIKAMQIEIRNRINGNPNHGWGMDDSAAVIGAAWKDETGEDCPAEIMAEIRKLCNPSAFLASLKKAGLQAKGDAQQRKTSALLAGLVDPPAAAAPAPEPAPEKQ